MDVQNGSKIGAPKEVARYHRGPEHPAPPSHLASGWNPGEEAGKPGLWMIFSGSWQDSPSSAQGPLAIFTPTPMNYE